MTKATPTMESELYHSTTKILDHSKASIEILARPEQREYITLGIGGEGGEGVSAQRINVSRKEMILLMNNLMQASKSLNWDKA